MKCSLKTDLKVTTLTSWIAESNTLSVTKGSSVVADKRAILRSLGHKIAFISKAFWEGLSMSEVGMSCCELFKEYPPLGQYPTVGILSLSAGQTAVKDSVAVPAMQPLQPSQRMRPLKLSNQQRAVPVAGRECCNLLADL
jgi:hypothetical protein